MFIGDNFLKVVDVIFFVLVSVEGEGFFEELFGGELGCFLVAFDEFISGGGRS